MFHRLLKFFFRPQSASQSKFQAFILEPILTPSGIVDTEDLFDTTDSDALDSNILGEDVGKLPFVPPEFASPVFESGYFTVGDSGEVGIDFLFDSGKYQFELAIFSLEDLDETPGSEAFVQEAARRALTNSSEGYTVIRDRLEGARFDGDLGEGKDWNSGEYKEVKTFKMEAGTQFGMMLVPNGTIEDVYENPKIGGSKAPLFSLSTANPNDALHIGQIADVTGDGNTFVMEDVQQGHKWFDRDYNDLIFQVRGATGEAIALDEVMDPGADWRETEMGQSILDYVTAYEEMPEPDLLDVSMGDRPLVGIIDTGFSPDRPDFDYDDIQTGRDWIDGDENPFIAPDEGNEAGTHRMEPIGDAPLWVGRADASTWSDSLTEFVDTAIASEQPHAVANISIPFLDAEGNTRYELTLGERDAIAYARENGVILVVAAGDDGGVTSALAQASREFDNIITVGSSEGLERADYSNFGQGLDILADGGTEENPVISHLGNGAGTMAGTGVAASQVTGAVSQVWAANPDLSYPQVIDILGKTARDLGTWGEDGETGAGLLNIAAAVNLAAATNASTYIVDEDWEEIEYIKGDGGNPSDRPSPEPNYLPQNLNFVIDRLYNPTEAVSLAGKISDRDGTQDLQRIEFWLQKDGGKWEQLEDVKEFIPQGEESALFERDLGILDPGNYRLQALAYDSANVGWEMETKAFTVLSTPEDRELSSRVKWSSARSLDLSSYPPHSLTQTREWVVSVQAGQSAADLAAAIGAVNLGATGRIPNTHTWRFPEGMDATAIAARLDRKGIEYAYPLVSKQVDFYTPTDTEPFVKNGDQWHLHSNGNFDANISQAWKNHGVSGEGVEIGIVDSGFAVEDSDRNLQTHSDLRPNYNPDLSYDFDEGDEIPSVLHATAGLSGLKPIYPGEIGYKFTSAVHGAISNLSVDLAIDHPQSQDFTVTLIYRRSQSDPRPSIKIPLELDSTGKVSRIITELDGESALGTDWKLLIENPSAEMGYLQHLQLNFETEDHHGTKVAGVAAASGSNGIGGSGVAPEAEWAGLRMGTDGLSPDEAFDGLSHKKDIIDIYNNSWGLTEIFTTLPDGEEAIEQGVKNGRGGLGNIYVFAAGNNQKDEDGARYGNVNYNSFANSRHTIAVAAIDHQGKQATYSAPGAPLLVSAHSSSGTKDDSDRPIVTTNDYDNDYTIASYSETGEDFGGTSSAAPLVSGVIALMLETNPQLTYRDVQAILLKTAQMNDPGDRYTEPEREHEGWYQNGGGYWVNPKYGFGAVDANAAVELAKNWTPLPPYDTVTATVSPIFDLIPDLYEDEPDTGETLVSTLTIPPADDMQVEWVEVEFLGNHQYKGDLEIVLVSPDGTRSVLAESHRDTLKYAQTHSPTRYDWIFTSVRHWGEAAAGEWRLEVTDKEYGGAYDYPQYYEQHNFLAQWKLNVHGTKPEDQAPIPDNSWIRQMGTTGSDLASGVTVDDHGNVYVVGTTDGDLDGTNAGQNDVFVTKYDVDGNLVWKEQIGTSGIDETRDIAVGPNGHIYITGHTFENLVESNQGLSDVFFMELDADGQQLLKKQVGSSSDDYATGITIDDAGDIYLTGFTGGNLEGSHQGGFDPWVAKYNSSGEKQWNDQFATPSHEGAIDIAIDSLGNTYIVGHSYGEIGGTNEGSQDTFIIKYDSSGVRQWEKQLGTSEYEEGHGIAIDSEDNIYIVGNTQGSIEGQNQGLKDVFVAKFNPQGDELWKEQFGSTVQDSGSRIAIDRNDIVYVTGVTSGTLNDRISVGGEDAFVTQLDSSGNHLETQILGTTGDDLAQDVHIDRSGNVYLAGYTQGDLGAENAGDRDFWVSKNYIQPSVTITTNQTNVNEDGDPVSITITRTGETEKALTVNLDIAGSAVNGEDFETLPETVEIPAGQSSVTIPLTPKDDLKYEGEENISVNVSDGLGYKLGEDNAIAFNLADDETLASVAIESVIPVVNENGFIVLFEITREGGNKTNPLTVNLDISGTATKGIDYPNLPNTITIPANKDSAFLVIQPLDDNKYEGNETVVINVVDGTGYTENNSSSFATIVDNDPAPNETGYDWTWTYFGEDFNPNGNDAPLTNTPNSDKARNEFLANLENVKIENLESYADASVPTTLKFGDETATVSGIRSIRDFSTGGYNGDGTYPISGDNYMFHYAESETIKIDFKNPQSAFGFSTTDAGDSGSQVIVTLHREDGSTEELIVPHGQGGINWGEATFFGVTDLENPFVSVTLTNTNYKYDGFGIDDLIIGDIKPDVLLNTATPPNQTLHLAYREDTPLNLSDILVTDPDGEATVKLTLSRPTEGSLAPATSGNVTSTYDPITGVWQASGEIADINRLLADLHFTPRNNAHGSLDIATEITVGDTTHTGSIALTGIPINDRPTLTAIASFTGAKEGQPFTLTYEDLLAASDAKDIDNTDLSLQILTPSNGTLTRDGLPVASGTPLKPGETLVWTPDTSGDRIPAFRVKAFDGELYSETEVEVAIAVSPNDTPTLQVEPAQQWVRQLGSSGYELSEDVAVDKDGNVFLAGWVTGDVDGNTYQGRDAAVGETGDSFLTKYDSQGNKLWTKTLGSDGDDAFKGVVTDDEGNAYVVGATNRSLDGDPALGSSDAFFAKYDRDGNLLWSRQVGTSEHDRFFSIATDDAGSFYTAGATAGIMDGTSSYYGHDALIMKWDSDGNQIWTRQLTSTNASSTSHVTDTAIDPDTGDVVITGYVAGTLDGETHTGSHDILVARYDRDGNLLWNRQFGSVNSDIGEEIAIGEDGNIYISGAVSEALEGENYEGGRDAFIAKLDKNGNILWTEQFAGDKNVPNSQGNDHAYGLGVDANNQIYVTGHIGGSLDGNEHAGTIDAFVAGFDKNGNRTWSQQFGFPSWDMLYRMDFDDNNNMFVAGAVSGAVPGQTHAGSLDPIVAKYSHTQTYFANTPFELNGIYVNDTEGDTLTVTLTLSDANAGTLTSTTTNDASTDFTNGILTVEGATEDVNAVLKDLQFNPATDYTETVTIATSVSDPYNNPVTGATMTLESDAIALNHWNASFINRTYPSTADRNTFDFSNPVATLDLGEQAENGKLSLTRNWGDGSPDPAVQTDQYAMRAWTRTQFEAGQLYKITTQSDDGVWFHLKNTATGEWVDDSVVLGGDGADWRDRGTADAPRTIFFKVPESGEYDFHVDYYENTGGSVVDFTLEEAQPFQDFVNPQTQWETEFYWWDRKPGNQPPANMFANGGDPSSKIGTANLGSNIRSDGKSGLTFDWGANAALNDVRLPDNNYAILARTQTTLEAGRNYQLNVRGDDGFQLLARNRTTGEKVFITPENQWQQAYGSHQNIKFSVPSDGEYDIEAQFYEERGDAYFDLSWEPINFSGRVISTINSNLRAGPSTSYAKVGWVGPNTQLTFDKWANGQFIDYTNQLGTASSLWYRIAGTNQWISGALIAGSP